MKKIGKNGIVYFALGIFAWLFNAIYGLFAHGVKSVYMANMWVVLLAGAVFYILMHQIPGLRHRRFYRLFTNVLNTSVAVLVIGMLLRGIIDIAGSSSNYIIWYFNLSLIGFALSFILLLLVVFLPRRKSIRSK
ncbi:MAG: hypothetical protein E4G74_04125 [Erysipelotrichales bacterium]|nr:MAG: hypothetical protein E4G74_04125 [Erysipelotrichales bacterium]